VTVLPREKQIEVIAALCESVGGSDLIDAALATQPITPASSAPERRKRFTAIEGGRK
jgi:hypothetical protein